MRCILAVTFLASLLSDWTECRPFENYWQVQPDPGPQCRQGYAQLITTAACSALTDLLLVVFPIPMILASRIPARRKAALVALFSLGLCTVCVTAYRVPQVVAARGDQATRSGWAAVELLVATTAANAVALASFMRDAGQKKNKFKYDSRVLVGRQQQLSRARAESWDAENGDSKAGVRVDIKSADPPALPRKDSVYRPPARAQSTRRGGSPTQSEASLLPRGGRAEPDLEMAVIHVQHEVVVDVDVVEPVRPSPAAAGSLRGARRGASTAVTRELGAVDTRWT